MNGVDQSGPLNGISSSDPLPLSSDVGHGIGQIRQFVDQVRAMATQVSNSREAVLLVRKANAGERLVSEALKACVVMEDEQFELRQAAAEAHLRTQRRAGELLSELQKHPGGRPSAEGSSSERRQSLRALGISRNESHRWQRIANLSDEQFERYVSECWQRKREITIAGALALARRHLKDWEESSEPAQKRSDGAALLAEYQQLRPHMADAIWLDPVALARVVPSEMRDDMRAELERFRLWITELIQAMQNL